MYKFFTTFLLIVVFQISAEAQIKVTSASGTFDTLKSGTPIYYQFSWDDPMDDFPEKLRLPFTLKAFNTFWDSMVISDGSVHIVSSSNPDALLLVDATGWDLMDIGNVDTINYPNLSMITVSDTGDEVEWLNFGFYNELEELDTMLSTGSVKVRVNNSNTIDFIYGDYAISRPDLCFEGFGSLRPSVTYVDSSSNFTTWYIYGDPASPAIDTLKDTAFDHLPLIGQRINLDFNKTNFIKRISKLSVKISPNPVANILNISGSKDFSGGTYQVIAMDGNIVSRGRLGANEINVEELKTGNFILKIHKDDQLYFARFMKLND